MNTGTTRCMTRPQLADYDLPPLPALEQAIANLEQSAYRIADVMYRDV